MQQVVAGTGIAVNATDPTKPVVSTTPGLGQYVLGAGLAVTIPTGGALTRVTNDLTLTGSGYGLVFYQVRVSSVATLLVNFRMYGVIAPTYFDMQASAPATVGSVTMVGIAAPGSTISVYGQNTGASPASTFADPTNHQLFAIGLA